MGFSVSKSETTDSLSPKIKLTPGKQVLHGPAPIKVMIEDANGGFSNYRFTVMYNGVDVTRSFTQYSKKSVNLFTKTLTIEYPRVRLKANQEHWIEFSYRNNLGGSARAHYEAPSCGAFKPTTVLSTGDFETPQYFMELVEDAATKHGLNPAFLAGLIAQESGFNPKQVSWAKAVGLTQVTSSAEKEIAAFYGDWPRYPGISHLNFMKLRLMIAAGRINSKNEWRLNPSSSIMGGAKFARDIADKWADKWNSDKNLRTIASEVVDPESVYAQLILASYHSGYARVLNALGSYGQNWLKSPDLREARKYIRRVFSYCSYFTDKEIDHASAT
ncbi:MAG: transglycosylase SLT domain-containing protein [Bdellovibrionota bacterium]